MKKYVQLQTAVLLRRLAFQVTRTSKSPDADAVHDLRVAIRRLSRALRTFRQFFPKRAERKILGRLKTLMNLAGQVRDRDIALELLAAAGVPARAGIAVALRRERDNAGHVLLAEIHRWSRRGFSHRWRGRLEL